VARADGMLPLREAAMRLVNNAETSIEEINRVTFVA
jgi:type II secretory ATPase GspE/PulE/Tfp pilus assembly ATPase PilB-like protein